MKFFKLFLRKENLSQNTFLNSQIYIFCYQCENIFSKKKSVSLKTFFFLLSKPKSLLSMQFLALVSGFCSRCENNVMGGATFLLASRVSTVLSWESNWIITLAEQSQPGVSRYIAQQGTMAARSTRETHKCKYFRLKELI